MERIGKYVIHQTVITTGYDRVFLCHDPDLQVPVAVKLFQPFSEESYPLSPAQQLTRFLTGARAQASFDHPYIVGIKVMEQLGDGRPYFVMPFLAAQLPFEIGRDFTKPEEAEAADPRDKPRPMAPPRAMIALKQLTSAVLALHRRGMVHRFIKPSNVLLTASQGGALKLTDFSMVKLPDRNLPMPDHWMAEASYTAPEQRENATAVTPRADVYSLGVMAYRLLTGTLPPPESDGAELPGGFPPELASLIRACTLADPEKRPAHAGEVLGGLEKVPAPRQASRPEVRVVQARPRAAAAAAQGAAEAAGQ